MTTIERQRLGSGFAKVWGASTTSALGSGLATVATPLLVASRTSNPLVVAGAAVATWLPFLVFALPGGVLVDRIDRRRVMIVIDWLRVVALAVLSAFIVLGHPNIVALYAVLIVINTGEVIFRNASIAFVASVVPTALLERANGWLVGGAQFTASLIAGPLGGFLFVLAASAPFLVNTVTYAVSAILIGLIATSARSIPERQADRASASPVWADMVAGLRWLMRHRLLRTMGILIGLLNVTLTAALAVLVLLAKQRLHLGSVGYGALFSCLAIGGITGSLIADRLIAKVGATWTIRVGLLIEAGLHLTLATSRSPYLVGFAFLVFGVHGTLWTVVSMSLRQRLTPPEMLGRVSSGYLLVSAGGNCVGAALGGALASGFGITGPYWVGFGLALVVAVVTWPVFDRPTMTAAYATIPG